MANLMVEAVGVGLLTAIENTTYWKAETHKTQDTPLLTMTHK